MPCGCVASQPGLSKVGGGGGGLEPPPAPPSPTPLCHVIDLEASDSSGGT